MNKKFRVSISTGQGRLHLIESAKNLKLSGVDIRIITGWIPAKWIPNAAIDFMGRFVGRNNLSNGFSKRRIEEISVNKIATCGKSEFILHFLLTLAKLGFFTTSKASVWGWKLYGFQSKRFIKDIDVLHVRSGAGQAGVIKRAKAKGYKVLVDHSIAHPQEVYNQLLKTTNGVDKQIEIKPSDSFWSLVLKDCSEADALLVNSQYVKDSFVQNGYNESKIFVAELGIRNDFIGKKKNWEIKDRALKLIFTGGFGRRKGAILILECMKMLSDQNIAFELNVFGTVVNDFDIPEWVQNSKNIIFHGHVPQDLLQENLINSDIYIFPSYSEGAAQSLKEAMAIGLPVIATVQSGAPLIDRYNGLIIKDHCVDCIVDSIKILIKDETLRERIGSNASKTISENHTWDKYSEKVKAVYSLLIKNQF